MAFRQADRKRGKIRPKGIKLLCRSVAAENSSNVRSIPCSNSNYGSVAHIPNWICRRKYCESRMFPPFWSERGKPDQNSRKCFIDQPLSSIVGMLCNWIVGLSLTDPSIVFWKQSRYGKAMNRSCFRCMGRKGQNRPKSMEILCRLVATVNRSNVRQ